MKQHIALLLVLIFAFTACTHEPSPDEAVKTENQKEETESIQQRIDSLSKGGKHGYFATTYIVGRLKKTEIENGQPFNINILQAKNEWIGKEIKFKILDSITYQLSYQQNEREQKTIKGKFNKPSGDHTIQLLISTTVFNTQTPDLVESLKMIDYLIKIHAY